MIERLIFADQQWVHLVWLAIGLVALLAYLEFRSGEGLGRFMSTTMQARLARRQTLARCALKLGFILATLVLGVLGLMRPQTPAGAETVSARRAVADIMIVLDVSNSMLAEDAAPDRLARAKAEIGEFISRVEGHRVGLVVFAGRGSVRSPLTTDYGFFRLALRDVDTRSVSLGGTRIGDAIRSAVAAFGPNRGAPRLMLLITDGEDHDSYPLDAVDEAVAAGVRIAAIGFGSEAGSEITMTDPATGARSVLTDQDGNVVISRLDGDLLREIALRSEGIYVPAGTSALDLDSIVETYVEPLVTDTALRVAQRSPNEHYRWFVLAALGSLVAAVWVGSSAGMHGGDA